jgi:hypothetical protein
MRWLRRLPRWVPVLATFVLAYFTTDALAFVARLGFSFWYRSLPEEILEPHLRQLDSQLV